ncbi:hypothetical protein A2U01_0029448 [Trifolium medium]|uniref:Uncharacterized protein n=1 Tax=Trifolium medium TaxID=97028 RepID=A0A392P8B8_9FABA|nr:hypothetical protein [Trifolium medium]
MLCLGCHLRGKRCRRGNWCLSRWRESGGGVCRAAGDGDWVTVMLGEEVGGDVVYTGEVRGGFMPSSKKL